MDDDGIDRVDIEEMHRDWSELREKRYWRAYGEWLRGIQNRRNLSQEAFAAIIGISTKTLGNVERAACKPYPHTRQLIKAAVTEDDLAVLDRLIEQL